MCDRSCDMHVTYGRVTGTWMGIGPHCSAFGAHHGPVAPACIPLPRGYHALPHEVVPGPLLQLLHRGDVVDHTPECLRSGTQVRGHNTSWCLPQCPLTHPPLVGQASSAAHRSHTTLMRLRLIATASNTSAFTGTVNSNVRHLNHIGLGQVHKLTHPTPHSCLHAHHTQTLMVLASQSFLCAKPSGDSLLGDLSRRTAANRLHPSIPSQL